MTQFPLVWSATSSRLLATLRSKRWNSRPLWLLAILVVVFCAFWASLNEPRCELGAESGDLAPRRVQKCDASDPGSTPPEAIGSQIGASIIAGVRDKYGYKRCANEWIDAIRQGVEDGFLIAAVIAEDRCNNLVPAAIDALQSKNPRVRIDAAWLLGRLGDEAAVNKVKRLAYDFDGAVATQAIESICLLSPKRCEPLLRELVERAPAWQTKSTALHYARRRGLRLDVHLMSKLLDSERPEVASEALRLLSCEDVEGSEGLVNRVRGLLQLPGTWEAAVATSHRCRVTAASRELLDLFQKRAGNLDDDRSLVSLIDAVTACAGAGATQMLEQYVIEHSSPPERYRIGASNVITPLERAVKSLGEVGGRSSMQALSHALADPYYRVRAAALRALEQLRLECEFEVAIRELSKEDSSRDIRASASELAERASRRCPDR